MRTPQLISVTIVLVRQFESLRGAFELPASLQLGQLAKTADDFSQSRLSMAG